MRSQKHDLTTRMEIFKYDRNITFILTNQKTFTKMDDFSSKITNWQNWPR